MIRRSIAVLGLLLSLLFAVSCANKKVNNPLANVGSKQPDKVLFDRAMDALKHNKFDVARMTLQTLINAYPDSEYIARAKLAVGDSWYAEGGSASLAQAETEYKDFITFFPNMPEAAEAQLKIANIHYQQMEKPDRDFTHAMRAEDEYRQLILQYPDSKLVPKAQERLREVQEVLAEREFRIGRFYFLRQAWPAAIARLKDVADRYPLYSGADESLYTLGQAYEGEVNMIRAGKMNEVAKGKLIQQFTNDAAQAYSQIIRRYPVMDRAADAKHRLEALHRPVPVPTPEAVAQNKAEEASRHSTGMMGRVMLNLSRHPDTAQAARVGQPTLVDPKPTSATEIAKEAGRALTAPAPKNNNKVSVETVGTGAPPPNQPVPRSDNAAPDTGENAAPAAENSTPASGDSAAPAANGPGDNAAPAAGSAETTQDGAGVDPAAPSAPSNTGIPELAPNVPENGPTDNAPAANAAPAKTGTATGPSAPAPAPAQVNDAATDGSTDSANSRQNSSATNGNGQTQDQAVSSSKKKKKKHKFNPF